MVAKAVGAPLVRLRGDAEEGRPRDPRAADRLIDVGRRYRRGLRVSPSNCTSCRSAWTPSCSSPPEQRVRNRIIAIASADVPLKGVGHLLHAVARLRVERDLELQLVAKLEPNGPTEKLIAELGISDIVHSSSGLSDSELADLLASAEIACIPSLYEGFSLPAVEAMASGTRSSPAGPARCPRWSAPTARCARLVRPADVDELTAVLGELLDSPLELRRLGAPGAARARRVQLGIRCGTDRRGVRAARTRVGHADRRLRPTGVGAGTKVIDVGCGAGRHSFEAYRRGADVIAFDQDGEDLNNVDEHPAGDEGRGRGARLGARPRRSRVMRSTCPIADGTFDCVIASRSSSMFPRTTGRSPSLIRVLKPGGRLAVTVPRWLPERVCWLLSDEYHANEGGHIRIYRPTGCATRSSHTDCDLTTATTPMRCTRHSGGSNALSAPRIRSIPRCSAYHKLLVWDMMQPAVADPGRRIAAEPADRQERCAVLPKPEVRVAVA